MRISKRGAAPPLLFLDQCERVLLGNVRSTPSTPRTGDPDNNEDPSEPAELVYGRRMSGALAAYRDACRMSLRSAPCAANTSAGSPRSAYPEGKAGYFAWRNAGQETPRGTACQIMGTRLRRSGDRPASAPWRARSGCSSDPDGRQKDIVAWCSSLLRRGFAAKHAARRCSRHPRQYTAENVASRPRGRTDSTFTVSRALQQGLKALEAAPCPKGDYGLGRSASAANGEAACADSAGATNSAPGLRG